MSELPSQFVKRGIWTNLEQGPVLGQTITTDIGTGTVVIALLAVLSSIGTAHLWHLLVFVYHQSRANGQHRDALFRQQQATLRTLPTPSTLLAEAIKSWWAWRNKADSALSRSLLQGSLALLCTLASLSASILSSWVITSSNIEVLVDSPHCGVTPTSSIYQANLVQVTHTYASECYQNMTSLPQRCNNIFTRPNIPLVTSYTDCPFLPSMCVHGTNDPPAVSIDSGLVSVRGAFGLNIASHDDMRYRRRTTCAVLPTEGHTSIINASDFPTGIRGKQDFPGEQLILYHYGQQPLNGEWANTTAFHSLLASNLSRQCGLLSQISYQSPIFQEEYTSFEPMQEMKRDDADIALMGVFKYATEYLTPVDDLVFSAHRESSTVYVGVDGGNATFYLSDTPGTFIGCTAQYQFCIAENCTPLGGLPADILDIFPMTSNIQAALLELFVNVSFSFDISTQRDDQLNALTFTQDGTVKSMPDNQWVVETQYWEYNVWASIQGAISDYAIGPAVRAPSEESMVGKPVTDGEKALCNAQKMRKAGGFVNINCFGLVFIVVVSCTFMALDIGLLHFLIYLSKFRRALAPRSDRWIQDGVLQLQRRAYEGQGQGTWTNLDQEIPLTVEKELLSDLQNNTNAPAQSKGPPNQESKAAIEPNSLSTPTQLEDSSVQGSVATGPIARTPLSQQTQQDLNGSPSPTRMSFAIPEPPQVGTMNATGLGRTVSIDRGHDLPAGGTATSDAPDRH
ncbi:hypothetical protein BDV95DRAFT_28836 [Massariosphaeria phaeospora]|uniref:Uncharacterized protein n=1 Tax=Massariosphaeria phaeospora TaxID=100035 RepID=A0A7C8I6C5_9PLEO|nr:hypothetical protein BDV95DRAFT_28836 [Massariosphaeria phaeospora]